MCYILAMNTKTLSPRGLSVINQYIHFKIGNAIAPVPYFNNKTVRARAALRVNIGKGSPKEIFEEIRDIATKENLNIDRLTNEEISSIMKKNHLGIDCSGFAYYVLNAESVEMDKGPLEKHLHFIQCHGFFGKIACAFRPVENCGVATFAHDHNSRVLPLKETQPGDIITITTKNIDSNQTDRNHILVIHQVEYQNFLPITLHYSHAIFYPTDGVPGGGIKQGIIEIVDAEKSLVEARWIENSLEWKSNPLFARSQISLTELRRLRWF